MSDADSMLVPQMGEFYPNGGGIAALDYESIEIGRFPDGSRSLRVRLRGMERPREILLTQTAASALASLLSPTVLDGAPVAS